MADAEHPPLSGPPHHGPAFEPERQIDGRLQAYLDGELDPRAQSAFEAELEQSPDLRDRFDSLRAIEAGLRSLHQRDPATVLPDLAGGGGFGSSDDFSASSPFRVPRRYLAYAAAVALLGLAWLGLRQFGTTPVSTPDAGVGYARVTADFTPETICDTPEEFVDYTVEVFGTRILASFETDVTLIGWRGWRQKAYESEPGPNVRRVLLAEGPSGERVIALFQRPPLPDPIQRVSAGGPPLNIFRGEVAGLEVFEISPLNESVLLPLLFEPG